VDNLWTGPARRIGQRSDGVRGERWSRRAGPTRGSRHADQPRTVERR